MENKPNLPPHLQERLEQTFEKQWQYQQGAVFLKEDLIHAFRRNVAEFFYRKAYQQAYSVLMQELGPVVELVNGGYEQMQYMNPNVQKAAYNKGVLDVCRRISKHLKERILNGN